jgi:hypothetical protein
VCNEHVYYAGLRLSSPLAGIGSPRTPAGCDHGREFILALSTGTIPCYLMERFTTVNGPTRIGRSCSQKNPTIHCAACRGWSPGKRLFDFPRPGGAARQRKHSSQGKGSNLRGDACLHQRSAQQTQAADLGAQRLRDLIQAPEVRQISLAAALMHLDSTSGLRLASYPGNPAAKRD